MTNVVGLQQIEELWKSITKKRLLDKAPPVVVRSAAPSLADTTTVYCVRRVKKRLILLKDLTY